ncbi:hypothetical protein J4457_02015 [Candidatus Woesearchaeota archaeon]|nr:hypothetical protein [Candidatus Woesearchaeota archaeon]
MKFIDKQTIELDKELNELDKLVLRFISILKKHSNYVIVSGYISILLGRTRATEDVDLFIKPLSKEQVKTLYEDLEKAGFWCLNTDTAVEMYDYLHENTTIRFALQGQVIPNFEVKFAQKGLSKKAFEDCITVKTKEGNLIISSLERQIAFKKYYLKSEKDLEDARHIEKYFKENIDFKKIEKVREEIEHEMA